MHKDVVRFLSEHGYVTGGGGKGLKYYLTDKSGMGQQNGSGQPGTDGGATNHYPDENAHNQYIILGLLYDQDDGIETDDTLFRWSKDSLTSEDAYQETIDYLRGRGYIALARKNGQAAYKLTTKGEEALSVMGRETNYGSDHQNQNQTRKGA